MTFLVASYNNVANEEYQLMKINLVEYQKKSGITKQTLQILG
jgi:hypothetical protein